MALGQITRLRARELVKAAAIGLGIAGCSASIESIDVSPSLGTINGTPISGQPGRGSERLDLVKDLRAAKLSPKQVFIQRDVVFSGEPKRYEAFELTDALGLMKGFTKARENGESSKWGVTFVAADRFRVTIPLTRVLGGNAHLAFRESGRTDGQDWDLVPAKSEATTPAPFYLVWDDQKPSDWDRPSPYQILFVILEPLAVTYAAAYPSKPESVAGFQLFSTNCIWCHSINYVGGRSQREFNVPESYTETNSKEQFLKTMDQVQGITGNCPLADSRNIKNMPLIYEYLVDMADQKICSSSQECKEKDPL